MTRPLRIEMAGAVYHVTCRGDRREPIFMDDQDRRRLLDILGQGLGRFDAVALAFCLMDNHYHVVLQTRRPNLSRLMRHINGVYAQAFNRRRDLVGHLFQGRFHAVHVDRDAYLMEVCRYTELNPVRAHLVERAGDWAWSSYRAHCCEVEAPPWLDSRALWGHLLGRDASTPADRLRASRAYADLVISGVGRRLWEESLRQDIYLGGEAFIARMQAQIGPPAMSVAEIPEAHRRPPASLRAAFGSAQERRSAVARAYVEGGMKMREIAQEVGLSVSQVSRLIGQTEVLAKRAPGRRRRGDLSCKT